VSDITVTGSGPTLEVAGAPPAITVSGSGPSLEVEVLLGGMTQAQTDARIEQLLATEGPAWTQTDIPLVDIFAGDLLDLGTGGFSVCRYRFIQRSRTLIATLYALVAPDAAAAAGPLVVMSVAGAGLPEPVMPPVVAAVPGGFGYFSSPVSDGAFTVTAAPAITDLTGNNNPANAAIIFLGAGATTGQTTGLEALVGPGNPESWTGRAVTYQGRLVYETAAT
jgi:hypothetical protein